MVGSRRKQGTGTTPLGTYRLLGSFGTHARSTSWDLSYRKIRSGDYWVQDNQSRYYNRYRNKSQGGFRWWLTSGPNTSERLTDYRRQYEYAVNTSFNLRPGPPPRRRDLPARQRQRRHRRLRLGPALVHALDDGPPRPRPACP